MPRRKTNAEKVVELFKPDSSGCSEWVSVEEFAAAGLNWSTNGNQRHGAFWDYRDVIWEKRSQGSTAVTHLRMAGWREDESTSMTQHITPRVRESFEGQKVDNISLLPIPAGRGEIDHRYGHKSHPDYVELYTPKAQQPKHFQLLLSVNNSIKRQMCVKCISTKTRPRHPEKDFVEGTEAHTDRYPCSGCYVAEPERYR